MRSALSTAAAVLTLVAGTLVTGTLSAPTAEAAKEKANANSDAVDLLGVAYNFNGANEDSIIFLTNTNANDPIRAVVTARDSTGSLVGCGIKVLQPGASGVVYVVTSAKAPDWAENVLNLRVMGIAGNGTLFAKVGSQDGLMGQLAQVDAANGATKSIVPLIESPAVASARQAQIDECLTPGAGNGLALAGGTNIVTTEQPAKWSKLAKTEKDKD